MDLTEMGTKGWTRLNWLRLGSNGGLSEDSDDTLIFHKSIEFLDQLNGSQHFKKRH
jgi:hypothetical protein